MWFKLLKWNLFYIMWYLFLSLTKYEKKITEKFWLWHFWINFATCMSRYSPHVCGLFCKQTWWHFSSACSFLWNLHLQNVLLWTKPCFCCCDLSGVPISCFPDVQLFAFESESVHVCPDGSTEYLKTKIWLWKESG